MQPLHQQTTRLLIVEDDPGLRDVLRGGLAMVGFDAVTAADGLEALEILGRTEFAAVVLDVMLPGIDGVSLAGRLRTAGRTTPILMLSARSFEDDIVRGLESGADGYLAKPFSFRELVARVTALTRRAHGGTPCLRVGDVVLDPDAHEVYRGSSKVVLSKAQFDLLAVLMRLAGSVVRRQDLIAAAWGPGTFVAENTLDVAVSSLRSALAVAGARPPIRTVRGLGYVMDRA